MLLMSLATLLAFDLQVLMCFPRPLPLVITTSSAKVGFSQGNTWGVTVVCPRLSMPVKALCTLSGVFCYAVLVQL
jgi:hypothetical protein